MKRVIVVSKTHLDLGFTDFAENIRKRYLDEFIPDAITTAESANIGRRNFIWTTGSWLLREELRCDTPENREKLIAARIPIHDPHRAGRPRHARIRPFDSRRDRLDSRQKDRGGEDDRCSRAHESPRPPARRKGHKVAAHRSKRRVGNTGSARMFSLEMRRQRDSRCLFRRIRRSIQE